MTDDFVEMRLAVINEFDVEFYLSQAPLNANGNTDPVMHYLTTGWRNGLDPSPSFSTKFYLSYYLDIRDKGMNPFYHYIVSGRSEGRYSREDDPAKLENFIQFQMERVRPMFDSTYYVAQVPVLQGESEDAICRHFVTQGWRDGLDPSPDFSTSLYLENYPDVAASATNPLYHYAVAGLAEGRMTFPATHESTRAQIRETRPRPEPQIERPAITPQPRKAGRPIESEIDHLDVRTIAFFQPQFYPTRENDARWGAGQTIWRAVAEATPLFPDHCQPRLPFDFGFYDQRISAIRADQIAAARQTGVFGFCFNYYLRDGKPAFELGAERLYRGSNPRFSVLSMLGERRLAASPRGQRRRRRPEARPRRGQGLH